MFEKSIKSMTNPFQWTAQLCLFPRSGLRTVPYPNQTWKTYYSKTPGESLILNIYYYRKSIIVFVVEPEDVDLPVFISKLTNCLGVENLLSCLTEDAIERKLLSLNSHKACGADEVNSHVLKAFFEAIENHF